MSHDKSGRKGLKKVLLPLASIFLIFQSYKLIVSASQAPIESSVQQFVIAWVINMFVTGIFALTGFAHPTQKLLPESYYSIRNPERLLVFYRKMRIDLFKTFLLATLWRQRKQRKQYFKGTRSDFNTLIRQSKKSEFGHLFPFLILTLVSIYFLTGNAKGLGVFTMLWNILGNLYPIILQRHHRMRIQKIRSRLEIAKF